MFAGRAAAVATLFSTTPLLAGCRKLLRMIGIKPEIPFVPLDPTDEDDLKIAEGFEWSILIRAGEAIHSSGRTFGYNNDFLAYLPGDRANEGTLWVNHEYPFPLFMSGWIPDKPRTTEQVIVEQKSVGGSILKIQRGSSGPWKWVKDDAVNKRLDGRTEIPFVSDRPIEGKKSAIGTLANCAGGTTPWGHFLTCEENFDYFYGRRGKDGGIVPGDPDFEWYKFFDHPPEHYGWVVEVNPSTGDAKKLVALGRFSHESATCVVATDGRTVVYMGDDEQDQCIYKFIAEEPGSLDKGILYVANTKAGKWMPLVWEADAKLRAKYKDQTDVLIHAQDAAKIVGGTPQDRPEDIERDPISGAIFVALTNNKKKKNYYGSILKIAEKDNNPLSLEFSADTFLTGGDSDLACPDNMAFDRKGNLWITTDISGSSLNKDPYEDFGNNGLFFVPMSGSEAGRAFQVASAPVAAEFTGLCFLPDGETLLVCVQHPGETTKTLDDMTSHWPDGGTAIPTPAVVQISGPAMKAILGA